MADFSDSSRGSQTRAACDASCIVEHMFGSATIVRSVSWAGTSFDAIVEANRTECARRDRFGIGAITDLTLLRALSTLPVGVSVPWVDVDPVAAAYLDCAPDAVVKRSGQNVTRVAEGPLNIVALVKVVPSWRDGGRVAVLGKWAPVIAISRSRPASVSAARSAYQRAGIGLVYRDRSQRTGVRQLVIPTTPTDLSVARDRLVEVIYQRLRRQVTTTPATRSHAFSCFDAG